MNTNRDEFYEDTLLQIGHIGAEISQLLAFLNQQESNLSLIQRVKSQILIHDRAIIEKLGIAEQSIRDVRAMIDQWTAVAKAELQ